jgi:site-specific recombinase
MGCSELVCLAAVMKLHECEENKTMWSQDVEVNAAFELLRQHAKKALQQTTTFQLGQKKTATGNPDRKMKK